MTKQIYRLQAYFAGNWQDIKKYDDRDEAALAAKPLIEDGNFADVQVLEVTFDPEKKEVIESFPVDLDFFIRKAEEAKSATKEGKPEARAAAPMAAAVMDSQKAEEEPYEEELIETVEANSEAAAARKKSMLADLKLVLNLLCILSIGVFFVAVIEHYETTSRYVTKYICQKTDLFDCDG